MNNDYSNVSEKSPLQIDEFYLDLQEDGSKISMLSKEDIVRRPFPGLRPFKTSEFQLYNGRVGQSEELIKRLKKNRFLAVIGSSGTGKSSLVRAGLIPQLFGGYLHGAGSKWDIAICRPGKDPVQNLAVALSSIKTRTKDPKKLYEDFAGFDDQLSGSIYGLLDAKESLDVNNAVTSADKTPSNLLIIIDQFEELFRFDRKDLGKENIENHFVNLLLKAALDPSHSVYVIITMRSEFLGDCVKYRGLPEAINEGQYLVPQLTRNELKAVIENPVCLAGKKISANLVELLINEIEESKLQDSLDQLPILQHALMRTYNEAMKDGPNTEITYEHYKRIGEMEKALANHAESKFKELGNGRTDEKHLSKKQQITKIVFQALTDASTDLKGGRRPTSLKNIYGIAMSLNADENEVNDVINHFRDSDTSFIMPPSNTLLYANLIIDISHESLMRNWGRLNDWITEEMKMGNLYKHLNERRELHDNDNEEWVRGILLRELQDWKNNHPTNATWAARYDQLSKIINPVMHEDMYRKNVQFLKDSASVSEKIKEEEKTELQENIAREQKEKSIRKVVRVLAIAAVISFLFGIWAFAERNNATNQRKNAEKNAAIAVRQKSIADANAIEAKKNLDSANVQRGIAEQQRALADSSAALAHLQSIKLARYAEEASKQKNNALLLKDSAERKTNDFQKQLVKNALKNEAFYFSNTLDQAVKEAIIDSLFKTPSFDTRQIQLAQYIDINLLKQINDAVRIKESIKDDPIKNLQLARKIWSNNQHPVLKNLLLGVVNDNIFPASAADIARSIDLSKVSLAISNNNTGFAFNNGRQLVTGKDDNGKLLVNENSFDDQFNRFNCDLQTPVTQDKNIVWVNYNDSNNIASLVDSFKIETRADGKINNIEVAADLAGYAYSRISANGKRALLADKDGNVFLKNTAAVKANAKMDTVGNYRNKSLGNENILFSPNSQYLMVNIDGKAKVYNRNNKIIAISDWDDESIEATTFTADSKSIIAIAEGKMYSRDTLLNNHSNQRAIDLEAAPFVQAGLQAAKAKSVAISKNGKGVLITQRDDRIFLLQTRNGDSLFKKNTDAGGSIKIKEIGNSKNKSFASFYNDSTIITIQDGGTINLWPVYADFTDPADAINTVIPSPTFKDKLQDKATPVNFSDIMASSNTTELNTAADFYYRNEKIDNAKKLYQKLLDQSDDEMHGTYLSKILLMNGELNTVDRINNKLDAKRYTADTVKAYRFIKVKRLKENIALLEEQARLCGNKTMYAADLSSLYGSLSFNLLFINDYTGAVAAANMGVKLYPQNDWIYTNVALGNLLAGNYYQAETIYRKYRGEMFSDKSRTFKNAFLADFKDVEDAGIIASQDQFVTDVARIKRLLE